MGRPSKPPSLKLIDGSRRMSPSDVRSIVSQLGDAPLPPPPDWLTSNPHAVAEWHTTCALLRANGLLVPERMLPIAHMCAMHGKIVQMHMSGVMPSSSMNRTFAAMRAECGLTDLAQRRGAASADQTTPKNPFAALGKPGRGKPK